MTSFNSIECKKERVNTLNSFKQLANFFLDYYKSLIKDENSASWVNKKAHLSIKTLKDIIKRINIDLSPENINAYCQEMPEIEAQTIKEFLSNSQSDNNQKLLNYLYDRYNQVGTSTLFTLVSLAPHNNIIHDINWLKKGNIGDVVGIALGEKDVSIFEEYLPEDIKYVEDVLLPFYNAEGSYADCINIIRESIKLSNQEEYLSSNILLIVVTENIVRKLSCYIYSKQNPNLDSGSVIEYVYNFTSLDMLLSRGMWRDDYPVSFSEAMVSYSDIDNAILNEARENYRKHFYAQRKLNGISNDLGKYLKNLPPDSEIDNYISDTLNKILDLSQDLLDKEQFQIKIGLKVMLHFLVRKYKDDRNHIVHGNFVQLRHKWKNLLNFSALIRVFEVEKLYRDFYENQT